MEQSTPCLKKLSPILIFYDLKKPKPLLPIFETQYLDNPSYKMTCNFASNLTLTDFTLQIFQDSKMTHFHTSTL